MGFLSHYMKERSSQIRCKQLELDLSFRLPQFRATIDKFTYPHLNCQFCIGAVSRTDFVVRVQEFRQRWRDYLG